MVWGQIYVRHKANSLKVRSGLFKRVRRCIPKKKKYYKKYPAALSDERIMQRSGDFCCNDKVSKVS
ncbi:MAG: hypothetical protein D6780_04390, partial [Candidatus Dadabacteria bacterium]